MLIYQCGFYLYNMKTLLLTLFSISILQKREGYAGDENIEQPINRHRQEHLLMETIVRSALAAHYRGSLHNFVGVHLQGTGRGRAARKSTKLCQKSVFYGVAGQFSIAAQPHFLQNARAVGRDSLWAEMKYFPDRD